MRAILDNIALYQERKKEVGEGILWPITIIPSRYSGVYEGGTWLAFFCYYDQIPSAIYGDDIECSEFFEDHKDISIGRGQTPDAALNNLVIQIENES